MQTKLGNGYKPRSTTKQAKEIIRNEIKLFYGDGSGKDFLSNMKYDADRYNGGFLSRYPKSDQVKGAALVDAGNFACYSATFEDEFTSINSQSRMLSKIYGEENVGNWDGVKIHNTYKNLIGREYAAMLRERKGGKK